MQWYWGEWATIFSHTFDCNEIDYMRDKWYPNPLPREANDRREDGSTGIYPRDIEIFFWIQYRQLLCRQDFTKFLMDHMWSWKHTAGDNEQRRILLYPNGLGQVDRYGEFVLPIPVVVVSPFQEMVVRAQDYANGQRGAYDGAVLFKSEYLYSEAEDGTTPTPPDATTLQGGDWQAVIPWGNPIE